MLVDSTILDDLSAGISHIGSLQAQRAIQTRWWHHIRILQGHSTEKRACKALGRARWPGSGGNAHVRRGLSDSSLWDGFWLFGGSARSRRFERAVPVDREIATATFTSASGWPWRWDGGKDAAAGHRVVHAELPVCDRPVPAGPLGAGGYAVGVDRAPLRCGPARLMRPRFCLCPDRR